MPFIAQKQRTGAAVMPGDIASKFHKKEELQCPYCGGALKFRDRATDREGNKLRRAHFWHFKRSGGSSNNAGGCEAGGESPEHEEHKQIALEMLSEKYSGTPFIERKIGDRVADCGVEFKRASGDMRGVVAELQYKNKQKQYRSVTEEYLKHGFAVHWIFLIEEDWDHLFSAKEKLDHGGQEYWLGKIKLPPDPEFDLGDRIWYRNYDYPVRSLSDLKKDEHSKTRIKVDLPWVNEPSSAYLEIVDANTDSSDAELALEMCPGQGSTADELCHLFRVRPSKSIANAKFD